jgi:hypothetical protein
MRCMSSAVESTRAGSTTARFPCTHLGSIGLRQGFLLGNRQTRTRQPPSCLAWRLWAMIHSCTSWLTCQEALSQMRTRARFPWAVKYVASHARKAQVTPLTGRHCTKRNHIWLAVGT